MQQEAPAAALPAVLAAAAANQPQAAAGPLCPPRSSPALPRRRRHLQARRGVDEHVMHVGQRTLQRLQAVGGGGAATARCAAAARQQHLLQLAHRRLVLAQAVQEAGDGLAQEGRGQDRRAGNVLRRQWRRRLQGAGAQRWVRGTCGSLQTPAAAPQAAASARDRCPARPAAAPLRPRATRASA